ncbi:MAG TPA: phosphoenolpyruvate--protein phosphotransferase [Actinomycetota bacterium]|nr:phosphoenolpyruvate--protein phosphotransferase [Actinomycetota bacterium]
MVGIVLVSHSRSLAEGAAELARQMGGEDVHVAPAGGLDGPDDAIGTDAMRVLAAIESVWSPDGVLVLMDLGSAVLSAEMAIEFLDEDRRPSVLLTDAPFVEGAVAAAVAARLDRSLDEVASEARGGLAGKSAHLGEPAPPVAGAGTDEPPPTDGPEARITVVVDLPHGLHARPAARLVQTAGAFDADVRVADATAGRGPVSARSLNAVATLGATAGHALEIVARGPQADAAVEAVRQLAERRFDEAPEDLAPQTPRGAERSAEAWSGRDGAEGPQPDGVLHGLPASPGIAIGPARRFSTPEIAVPDGLASRGNDEELAALDEALVGARAEIARQRDDVAARAGRARAAIFEAHLLFLDDDALLEPTRRRIREGAAAAAAWHEAVDATAVGWTVLEDPYLRARAADLRSVGREVLARLLGVEAPRPRLREAGILVADDLAPADTAGLEPSTCLGVATASGGPTAHAAVLARALGIPAVVGLGGALDVVADGTALGLDGGEGLVYLEPDAAVREALAQAQRARDERSAAARTHAAEPARTEDGERIEVAANIGRPQDVAAAVAAGCDGVGLFRTEFLFMDRDTMPDEREQEAAYRAAAEALGGRPLLVRTLDAGADKPIPWLPQDPEPNPFLGVRGLRLGLARPDVLDVQLRALVRAAADHPIRIMFPMVSTLGELRAARAALDRACEATGVSPAPEVGIMIEVPAAALAAGHLAREADFFSVGTNDLTQYTLAADRGNARVGELADPLHPAVLRLIALAAEAAAANGRWIGVCGELAADADATELLLGLGVRELSMSAPAIPAVKEAVRRTELFAARELALAALELPTAADVRRMIRDRQRVPLPPAR